MARKTLKRENTVVQQDFVDEPLFSSGDTIRIDPDVVMADGIVDEGYHANHESKKKDDDPHNGVTYSDVSSPSTKGGLQVLGRGVKELVQKVQALRQLGVEDLVLPLPKIVVVGDQSTGKSSLIEGMSEIKVPRSAGTCTRCPLEINLTESASPGDPWSCRIVLHKKYNYEGKLGIPRTSGKHNPKDEGATRNRPLGPWQEQDSEDFPFTIITSKDEVVDALERAQLATLNPSSEPERYMPGVPLLKKEAQVKFSPNVIRLDITGPGLPNLSFYDLPGVVNVVDVPEEAYLMDLVRNLVKQYIKAENCVNLLALTMSHDLQTSSAFALIRDMKAEARTVGCLTKPDRLDPEQALEQWIKILRGEEFKLGFGYHVIKNNPDPQVDHATARREEAAFFSDQEPWNTTLSPYSEHFGTSLLQTALSQRLTAQIRTSLPGIIEKVEQKAKSIEQSLKELPEPLDGSLAVSVTMEMIKFERQIEKHFDGGSPLFPFQKDWHEAALRFRKDLADTRPVLTLQDPRKLGEPRYSRDLNIRSISGTPTPVGKASMALISIDSDDEDGAPSFEPSPIRQSGKKRSNPSAQSTPAKVPRVNGASRFTSPTVSKCFDLHEVRRIIQEGYISLPNHIDPKSIERMIVLSMGHWEGPIDDFLSQTKHLCETTIFEQVEDIYGKYSQTLYYETIRQICESFFKKTFSEQRQLTMRILSWELSKPKTYNEEAMEAASDKALTLLQTTRRHIRANAYINEQEAKTGKVTSGQARMEKLAKITDAQLGPEKYGREIKAMSSVKGYYECAYSRFIDVICASVHCELFARCRTDIVKEMKRQFAVAEPGAEERLAVLLASNPEQENRRAQLKREMETIKKAQEHLQGLSEPEE